MNPIFIRINGDIFNVHKLHAVIREDDKNCLGKDSGVYILHIYMEDNIGSIRKAYSSKENRDKDFLLALKQLSKYSIKTKQRRRREHELSKRINAKNRITERMPFIPRVTGEGIPNTWTGFCF